MDDVAEADPVVSGCEGVVVVPAVEERMIDGDRGDTEFLLDLGSRPGLVGDSALVEFDDSP